MASCLKLESRDCSHCTTKGVTNKYKLETGMSLQSCLYVRYDGGSCVLPGRQEACVYCTILAFCSIGPVDGKGYEVGVLRGQVCYRVCYRICASEDNQDSWLEGFVGDGNVAT